MPSLEKKGVIYSALEWFEMAENCRIAYCNETSHQTAEKCAKIKEGKETNNSWTAFQVNFYVKSELEFENLDTRITSSCPGYYICMYELSHFLFLFFFLKIIFIFHFFWKIRLTILMSQSDGPEAVCFPTVVTTILIRIHK